MRKNWQGNVAIQDALGVFRGSIGDNKLHSHWASQLTIALDDDFEVEINSEKFLTEAALITGGIEHRLLSGEVFSIYFDPTSKHINNLFDLPPLKNDWFLFDRSDLPRVFVDVSRSLDLQVILQNINSAIVESHLRNDEQIKCVVNELRKHTNTGKSLDRTALAALVGLSPSRFSHWFVEQMGVSVRSYKKWLKLRAAIDALLAGASPVEAALEGGFSDQAHLSRSFSAAFGLTVTGAKHTMSKQY